MAIQQTQASLSSTKQGLLEKIRAQSAQIAIVGAGYVGLPLAVCVGKVGFSAVCIDLSQSRTDEINLGKSYISDVSDEELSELVQAGRVAGSTDFSRLADADVIVICVPTPLSKNRDPDTSYITSAGREIAKYLRPGQLITLESTTYPGTTEELLLPLLAETGLIVGQDFFIVHSPERVDPGNARYTTHNTNKVLGGYTAACREVGEAFYRKIILDIVAVSSPSCAEMVKVFENTFRAVNIALVNELALLCDKMGINVWEVVDAAGTKPFGMLSFYPGPGVGGHCIPVDPFYLTWKAREYNFHTRFIELAGEINSHMPQFVREKTMRALGTLGKPLYGSTVLILGMAYKKDLEDWRESPGVHLFNILKADGVNVVYNDPHVAEIVDEDGVSHPSVPLTEETLASADCVVLITAHSAYDYDTIVESSRIVVDTRNACQNVHNLREKIVLL